MIRRTPWGGESANKSKLLQSQHWRHNKAPGTGVNRLHEKTAGGGSGGLETSRSLQGNVEVQVETRGDGRRVVDRRRRDHHRPFDHDRRPMDVDRPLLDDAMLDDPFVAIMVVAPMVVIMIPAMPVV